MSRRWMPVLGFEDRYEVSDDGQVRSLPNRWRRSVHLLSVARETGAHNYQYVTLHREGRQFHRRVHALILEAFVGPRPPGSVGRHLDDDIENCTLTNLAWGSLSDNALDMVANGNHNHARKATCKWGHPFEGDNLARTTKQRVCRACARRRNKEYVARKRDRALAVYAADLEVAA